MCLNSKYEQKDVFRILRTGVVTQLIECLLSVEPWVQSPTLSKSRQGGAREMAQWLGVLTILPEDLDSILSTYTAANNCKCKTFEVQVARPHPQTTLMAISSP